MTTPTGRGSSRLRTPKREACIRTGLLLIGLTGCFAGPPTDTQRYAALADARQVSLARGTISADGEGVDDALIRLLVDDPRTLSLTDLGLAHNHITAAGLGVLLASAKSEGLQVLDLEDNPIGDAGLLAIASSPRLATLEVLQLAHTGVGPEGASALAAAAPNALALRQLDLGQNALGDAGALALASLPVAARLSLEEAQISATGARALLETARCPRLLLGGNALGSGSLAGLTKLSPSLEVLVLTRTRIGAGDAVTLASLPAPALRELDLRGNALGDEGVRALAKARWFGQLTRLDIADTDATSVSLEALQALWGERGGLVVKGGSTTAQ